MWQKISGRGKKWEASVRCLTAFIVLVVLGVTAASSINAQSETWRGLTVANEHRCSEYDSGDYKYPQYLEADIVALTRIGIYGPYTGTHFESAADTDIEHMVARSEAHDSGLCAASTSTKIAFARDLDNLTLASPSVNRSQKRDKDAAEWLPDINKCLFADRVVKVRQEYGLTIDRTEANALDDVFSNCTSFEMVVTPDPNQTEPAFHPCDKNRNGKIDVPEVLEVIALYFAGTAS